MSNDKLNNTKRVFSTEHGTVKLTALLFSSLILLFGISWYTDNTRYTDVAVRTVYYEEDLLVIILSDNDVKEMEFVVLSEKDHPVSVSVQSLQVNTRYARIPQNEELVTGVSVIGVPLDIRNFTGNVKLLKGSLIIQGEEKKFSVEIR